MSWLFSRALVEGYSQGISSAGKRFALSSEMSSQQAFWCNGKTIEPFLRSRYGMTFSRLTDRCGEELLTWYRAGFHAKPIRPQLRERMLQTISGRKCDGSWQMSLPGTYLPKTSHEKPSTRQRTTWSRWDTKPAALSFPRQTWVLTTFGHGVGYLHTPTTRANYCAPSMQKWPACRAFALVFGKPTPEIHEWMMGWPIGWTALQPLETARFQQWRSAHFLRCAKAKEAA